MPTGNESPQSDSKKVVQRHPRYLQSIIAIFIIPVLMLLPVVWKKMPKKSFFFAAGTIALIGWAWSWTVTSHVWWSFGWPYMLGWDVIPHLPFEEVLFYPFGGILVLFIYVASHQIKWLPVIKSAKIYWAYLIVGTFIFATISYATRENKPMYLYSQLVTYNLMCCFLLAPAVAKEMNLTAMIMPVVFLLPVGFLWDCVALHYGWWDFHAITQIRIGPVPLDEFNFFFFAEPAALSIYLAYCRLFKESPILNT